MHQRYVDKTACVEYCAPAKGKVPRRASICAPCRRKLMLSCCSVCLSGCVCLSFMFHGILSPFRFWPAKIYFSPPTFFCAHLPAASTPLCGWSKARHNVSGLWNQKNDTHVSSANGFCMSETCFVQPMMLAGGSNFLCSVLFSVPSRKLVVTPVRIQDGDGSLHILSPFYPCSMPPGQYSLTCHIHTNT